LFKESKSVAKKCVGSVVDTFNNIALPGLKGDPATEPSDTEEDDEENIAINETAEILSPPPKDVLHSDHV
jgi:hypothetical protein